MSKKFAIPISRPTIIKYLKKFDLGHQIGDKGGKWAVHADKWRRFIDGKNKVINKTYDSESDRSNSIQKVHDDVSRVL